MSQKNRQALFGSAVIIAVAAMTALLVNSKAVHSQGQLSQPGDITAVNAGSGLLGGAQKGPATLWIDSSYVQRRIATGCGPGSAVRSVDSSGNPTCVSAGGSYSAGDGLGLSGTVFSLLGGCSDTQIPKRVAGVWACSSDADTTYTAGPGISVGGTTISANLAGAACSAGSFISTLSGSGSGTCTAEVGDIAGITTNDILTGGCTSGTCSLGTSITGPVFVGRASATTGAAGPMNSATATSMLDQFSNSLQGLVPASGGGSTAFLRADRLWAAPPDTLGLDGDKGDVIVGGSGTTLTLDSGTLTSGGTSVTVASGSTITLNADTTLVNVTATNPTFTSMSGGTDRRYVRICNASSVSNILAFAQNIGSPPTDGFSGDGAATRVAQGTCVGFVYNAGYSLGGRWMPVEDNLFTGITATGSITTGSSLVVGNTMQVSTGGIINIDGTVSSNMNSATPTKSAFEALSQGAAGGYISQVPLGKDSDHIAFDLNYSASTWTARHSSGAAIVKSGNKLNFLCLSGLTNGSSAAVAYSAALAAPCAALDLVTGAFSVPATVSIGGNTNIGTSTSDQHNVIGQVFSINNGANDLYVYDGALNFMKNTNAVAVGYINKVGYLAGTTQFRNLVVGDGKTGTVATFTGSSKAVTFEGTTTHKGGATIGDQDSDVLEYYKPRSLGTTPTISSCGATPATVFAGGFSFTLTIQTSGTTSCTATFASACSVEPTCTVTPYYNPTGGGGQVYVSAISASAVTVASTATGWTSGNKVGINCFCH